MWIVLAVPSNGVPACRMRVVSAQSGLKLIPLVASKEAVTGGDAELEKGPL